jgi:hypothetical protein
MCVLSVLLVMVVEKRGRHKLNKYVRQAIIYYTFIVDSYQVVEVKPPEELIFKYTTKRI